MTDAPKRIWINREYHWFELGIPDSSRYLTEYVRADLTLEEAIAKINAPCDRVRSDHRDLQRAGNEGWLKHPKRIWAMMSEKGVVQPYPFEFGVEYVRADMAAHNEAIAKLGTGALQSEHRDLMRAASALCGQMEPTLLAKYGPHNIWPSIWSDLWELLRNDND